jgi:glycine oxidase
MGSNGTSLETNRGALSELRVGIIGCGVVGAAIAYRLSKELGLEVQVFDQRQPETLASTGAALGVLMAAISAKLKGRHLNLRLESLQLYETLIPELSHLTGLEVPYNRHGILQLYFDAADLERWNTLQAARRQQGFTLEIWTQAELRAKFPELSGARSLAEGQAVVGALYSPQDRQVDPAALTQALIQGAVQQGARVHFEAPVTEFQTIDREDRATDGAADRATVTHLCTRGQQVPVDWIVVAAGLGSTPLTQTLGQPIPIVPVLGQAIQLQCATPLRADLPVVTARDVHLVPLSRHELWIGATVEFSPARSTAGLDSEPPSPDPQRLEQVLQQAIALNPALAESKVLRTWSGLRPRPSERAAPVIEPLPGYRNVLVASGHYRNGVLLAPITAEKVWALLQGALPFV